MARLTARHVLLRGLHCVRQHPCVSSPLTLGRPSSSCVPPVELEVERKFLVTAAIRAAVTRHGGDTASAVSSMTDVYFDDARFTLSTKDLWLRKRNKGFELKSPAVGAALEGAGGVGGLAGIDYYNEATTWAGIARELEEGRAGWTLSRPLPPDGRPGEGDSAAQEWLEGQGLMPFATIHTTRTRRRLLLPVGGGTAHGASTHHHTVHVDLDDVRYERGGSGGCSSDEGGEGAAELRYAVGEVEVVRAGGGLRAGAAMGDVFRTLGIGAQPVRGKVLEFLARFSAEHYAALERAGLIADKMR